MNNDSSRPGDAIPGTEPTPGAEAVAGVASVQRAEPTRAHGHQPPQDAPSEPALPGRQRLSLFVTTVIVLGAAALALGVLSQFASIIAPVFLALNLLLVTYPLYGLLARNGVPRILASIVAGLAVFAILVLGVVTLVWSGTSMIRALTGYSAQFTDLYYSSLEFLARFGFDQDMLLDQLGSISPSNVLGAISGVIAGASDATGIFLVLLLTLVFMVMDLPSLHHRFRITNRLHPNFVDAIRSLVVGIRRYWLVTTVFGLVVAGMDFVILLLVGVPLPLVWAVLAFVTNYIPNIGFVIGLLPPALLALMEEGPVAALIIVVAYSLINFVMQSIIQPKITGDAIGISPVISLLSLLVWTSVFGALGALMALPFTLMIKALLIDNDPRARWVNALISADPVATEARAGKSHAPRRPGHAPARRI